MKLAKTLSILGCTLLIGMPCYAQSGDVLNYVQNLASQYIKSWSDLDSRISDLSSQVSTAQTQGKLTPTQAADFKTQISQLQTQEAQAKASGRRLGFSQSIQFGQALNSIAGNLNQTMSQTVSSLPDIDTLRQQLKKSIDDAVAKNLINSQGGNVLQAELQGEADVESAYKAETGGNLTPRQIELLSGRLTKVKADFDQQTKISQSGTPALNDRRAAILAKVQADQAAGRLNAQQAASFTAELNKLAADQQNFQTAGGGVLNGTQVFRLAQELDAINEKESAAITPSSAANPAPVTTAELDAAISALTTQINELANSGRLPAPAVAQATRDLDRVTWQESSFKAGAGITTAQVQELLAATTKIKTGIDAQLTASTVVGSTNQHASTEHGSEPGWRAANGPNEHGRDGGWRSDANGPGGPGPDGAWRSDANGPGGQRPDGSWRSDANGPGGQRPDGAWRSGEPEHDRRGPSEPYTASQDEPGRQSWRERNGGAAGTYPNPGSGEGHWRDQGHRVAALQTNSQSSMRFADLPIVSQKSFSDVQGYWAQPYIEQLASRGVIGGFPNGNFGPDQPITRAQFAAIVAHAMHLDNASGASGFRDVPDNYWASGAIAAASKAGLITGYPDGSFRPEDKITRAQSLVILSKSLQGASNDPAALSQYSDANSVPAWAKNSIAAAANANIIVNFPNTQLIRANDTATRGDVAALMYQTLTALGANLPPIRIGLAK